MPSSLTAHTRSPVADRPVTAPQRPLLSPVAFTDGQGPENNDDRLIAWGRYDFCQSPTVISVLLYVNDEISVLSDGPRAYGPRASSTGAVAWTEDDGISVWDGDDITRITDVGTKPLINSRGDIAFLRFNEQSSQWETWLYVGGDVRRVAASNKGEIVNGHNDRGDIVIMSSDAYLTESDIVFLHRVPDGDMNCDERINFDDIDNFVDALTDRATYESKNPDCDWWLADVTGDRKIDFNDIDPFVNCLVNGGCER